MEPTLAGQCWEEGRQTGLKSKYPLSLSTTATTRRRKKIIMLHYYSLLLRSNAIPMLEEVGIQSAINKKMFSLSLFFYFVALIS